MRLAVNGEADDVAEPGFSPLKQLMDAFAEAGGQIYTCLPCFNKRELDEKKLVQGAVIVGGPKLVAFMADGAPSVGSSSSSSRPRRPTSLPCCTSTRPCG